MEIWTVLLSNKNYSISNMGEVKRITPKRGARVGKILKPTPDEQGYLGVGLYENRKRVRRHMHRLVAETFIGPRQPGLQINHIDGDKSNNSVDNLEYVSPKENMLHAKRLGLVPSGERNGCARLKRGDILEIRQLVKSGRTQRSVALEFKISFQHVSGIVLGRRWASI